MEPRDGAQFTNTLPDLCADSVTVSSPDKDRVQLAAADSGEQLLAFRSLESARFNLFDLGSEFPPPTNGVLLHGSDLQRQRLLVVG